MIEKILIKSKKDFDRHRKTYWKNDDFTKHYITEPESFPCIALQTYSPMGALGVMYEIDDYVYPEDFSNDSDKSN